MAKAKGRIRRAWDWMSSNALFHGIAVMLGSVVSSAGEAAGKAGTQRVVDRMSKGVDEEATLWAFLKGLRTDPEYKTAFHEAVGLVTALRRKGEDRTPGEDDILTTYVNFVVMVNKRGKKVLEELFAELERRDQVYDFSSGDLPDVILEIIEDMGQNFSLPGPWVRFKRWRKAKKQARQDIRDQNPSLRQRFSDWWEQRRRYREETGDPSVLEVLLGIPGAIFESTGLLVFLVAMVLLVISWVLF